MARSRLQRRLLLTGACLAALVFVLCLNIGETSILGSQSPLVATKDPELPCAKLPGAGDTVVALRTGSTEFEDKLSVHMTTTLRCYPNHLIFSDHKELYEGTKIMDALESVSPNVLDEHPDFELYRRLKKFGRQTLDSSELSGIASEAIQWHGKDHNPGWKLDKWKFLGMVNRTFYEYPNANWYIFVEADSFIFWKSTLQYLSLLDHTKPHYSGSQMYIGDVLFAHGGSGFFVSQPAMQMVVDWYSAHKQELETFTDGHWAGDCVLGKAFKDAGVSFTNSWPIFQGDYPGIVAYARPDGRPVADEKVRIWCYPTISYHHLTPSDIEQLWRFEQESLASNLMNETSILRHKDIFHSYVLPRMTTPRSGWDNESDSDEGVVSSVEACKATCEENERCRQYSFDGEGRCRTREDPRLGKAAENVESGWMLQRMMQFEEQMTPCGNESWLY